MNWIKEKDTKKSIVISIIGSAIFLVFIQPIMLFIWQVLKGFSSKTFEGLINKMYLNAALGQRNWIDFILLTSLLLVGILFALGFTFKLKRTVDDIQEKRKLEEITNDEEKEKLIASRIVELEHKIAKSEKTLIGFDKLFWVLIPLTLLFALLILFTSYTDLQLNTSFNQRINALAPYIKEEEITLLKSKWALMKTRADFLKINMRMDSLAGNSKIILPDNLLE